MPNIKTKTKFNEAGPRFLLFLKNRARSRWAKTSPGFEVALLMAFCLALFAIAVLAFRVFHHP